MNIWKINIPKPIIILVILSVTFNILRVVIWGKVSFLYMFWNMLLAFIPFIISSFLLFYVKEKKINKLIFIIGFILWLLFIPNAPYIITDFIHLGTTRSIPIIYDVFLLFSSASLGLILGFHSIFHIEEIINMKYKKNITSFLVWIIILMISFGIYLGRFLRFNSWDIFINHVSLVNNIWRILSQAVIHVEVYLYTLLFFFFLYLFYNVWKYSNIK